MRLNVAQRLERVPRRDARLSDADAEHRLRRRLRRHRFLQPRPRAAAQVGRRPRAGRRRVRRVRLDRHRPVRATAAAAQSRNRLRLQRQQRQRRGRPSADFRPGLGGAVPRPPHPAVLRHDRQAQPRHVGGHAGRPPVAGRQGDAAVHRHDRAVRRARAAGPGDARRAGTRSWTRTAPSR